MNSIPKIIWQTYETNYEDLPQVIKDYTNSWKRLNPSWEYRYVNAAERAEFILKEYGQEWYDFYNDLPINIMRSDFWRYLVVAKMGGVYVDIDCWALMPIESWLKNEYEVVLAMDDNNLELCQFMFASTANNKMFLETILNMKENIINNIKKREDIISWVFDTTGPTSWTLAVRKTLNIDNNVKFAESDYKLYNGVSKAKEYKVYCYGGDQFDFFHKEIAHHLGTQKDWDQTTSYKQWTREKNESEN